MRFGSISGREARYSVRRCRVALGFVVQEKPAKARTLTVAGPVDDQAGDAAPREIGHALEVLNLLRHIEAVEENHRGLPCADRPSRFCMNEDSRERASFVRHFNVFDSRVRGEFRRIPEAVHPAPILFQPLRFRVQEALPHVIVIGCAEEISCRACRVSCGESLASRSLDDLRLARPFAMPGFVIAHARFEPQPDAVHFADLCTAPRGGIESDEQAVRPAIVLGEIHERKLLLRGV